MSWLPSLGWASLIALAIPPLAILLFYFLKIRRPPVQVPSTLLWTRTIEDFNANAPWQRFRHQILLYLQLLAVGLIIFGGLASGLSRDGFGWRPLCAADRQLRKHVGDRREADAA